MSKVCWGCGHWLIGLGCCKAGDNTYKQTDPDDTCNEWVEEGTAGTVTDFEEMSDGTSWAENEYLQDEVEWAGQKIDELFEVERFKKLNKENDYVFQALVFLGEASQKLSIARTILKDNNVAVDSEKMKEMLDMQTWVHDFSQYLRKGSK